MVGELMISYFLEIYIFYYNFMDIVQPMFNHNLIDSLALMYQYKRFINSPKIRSAFNNHIRKMSDRGVKLLPRWTYIYGLGGRPHPMWVHFQNPYELWVHSQIPNPFEDRRFNPPKSHMKI